MSPLKQLECLRKLDKAVTLSFERNESMDIRSLIDEVREAIEHDVKNRYRPPSARKRNAS